MSCVRPVSKAQSTLVLDPLIQEDFARKVDCWKRFLSSCYGPHGTQVMIQNMLGGHVSITSSASQILNNVQASHPLVKVLIGSVRAHCKYYGDHGLFCALLGLSLTSSPVLLELPLSLVNFVRTDLFKIVTDHLTSGCHCCKLKVDVQNLKQLLATLTAILQTKTACVLSLQEIRYIATVIMQCFLTSLPSTSPSDGQAFELGQTHVVTLEGMSPLHSKHFSGLLHPIVSLDASSDFQLGTDRKVALFDVSLAGDTSEAPVADFRLTGSSSLVEDSLLLQLQKLGEELITLQIDVLACQKVIHPRLSKLLQKKGILTLDRLGQEAFSLLCKVSGGSPVTCIVDSISESQLGIADIEKVHICGKHYFCFKKRNTTVSSILLCHVQEECLAELQKACLQCLHSLKALLACPEGFVGAGCLEVHLANVTRHKIIKNTLEASVSNDARPRATVAQVKMIVDDFTATMTGLAKKLHPNCDKFYLDLEFGHLWPCKTNAIGLPEKCACSMVTSGMVTGDLVELEIKPSDSSVCDFGAKNSELIFGEGSIVDVSTSKLAAYECAFEISTVLLKTGLFIVDSN